MRQASTITSEGMKSRVPDASVRMNRKRAEAHAEVVVDRVDLVGEVGLQEDVADDDAADDEAQHQLDVREALLGVALARGAEERRRAGLGRDDRGHHGPPRYAPPAEREV